MSVQLDPPSQLGFARPLTTLVKRNLRVKNENSQPVAFKVKTTAPKQYCVRPNSGRIEPGETVEVQVLLQPMKEDPPAGAKCRDKFLVQSVVITPEREGSSLPELWSIIEKEDKSGANNPVLIHEQKIRCSYLPSEESSAPIAAPITNGNGASHQTPSAPDPIAKDESNFDTIRPTNGATRDIPTADSAFSTPSRSNIIPPSYSSTPSGAYATPAPSTIIPEKVKEAASTATQALNGAVSSLTSSLPSSSTTSEAQEIAALKAQLQAAQADIARLKAQVVQAESTAATLRSRGVGGNVSSGGAVPGSAQAVVEQKVQEGVPIQVVAGIAFGVFVVTWLFF